MVLRRSLVSAGVTALVVSLTPVVTSHTANATTELSCAASAPIYGSRSSGGAFVRYQHLEPETGVNSWGAQQQIGTWGITARHLAGPNGVIYNANVNGELRRMRWNGTSWDSFSSGLNYEIIDQDPGWAVYAQAATRNQITVDPLGDIYTSEPDGYLHWRHFDNATRTWTRRVVADWRGDPRMDLVAAAGPGVIYYRYGPYLHRFEYDVASQRSRDRFMEGASWDRFSRIFSPGGDILYAVVAATGDLVWVRFNRDTDTWANGMVNDQPVATTIATGLQTDFENFAAPDSCQSNIPSIWPTRPQVNPWTQAPVTLMGARSGHLHYSYVDEDGRAIHAEITDLSGGTPAHWPPSQECRTSPG